MFTVSDSAADAIGEIVTKARAPQGSGLRIATDTDGGSLQLALAAHPQPGDTVYPAGDIQVFVDERAADMLDGHAIHASTGDDGGVQFVLGPAPR